jgi:hypothetical protein
MEFQQKGQQITLSQGVIFMKTDGERIAMGEKKYRGTDVYGESIYTKRWNYWVLMNFLCRKMLFSFSYTDHDQNLW